MSKTHISVAIKKNLYHSNKRNVEREAKKIQTYLVPIQIKRIAVDGEEKLGNFRCVPKKNKLKIVEDDELQFVFG